MIMNSGTSVVLLNRAPGKQFQCKRGVRQGDPLSPLLFVLAADLLQSIFNKARDISLLRLPLQQTYGQDFPVIQYVDDTIMVLEDCPRQLFFLKAVINSFVESICLTVNYHKSNIYLIDVQGPKMEIIANTLQCQIGTLPFTYLGLPIGLTKPKIEAFLPMV